MRFRLRTLMIGLLVGPPLLASGWSAYCEYRRSREQRLIMTVAPRLIIQEEEFVFSVDPSEQ